MLWGGNAWQTEISRSVNRCKNTPTPCLSEGCKLRIASCLNIRTFRVSVCGLHDSSCKVPFPISSLFRWVSLRGDVGLYPVSFSKPFKRPDRIHQKQLRSFEQLSADSEELSKNTAVILALVRLSCCVCSKHGVSCGVCRKPRRRWRRASRACSSIETELLQSKVCVQQNGLQSVKSRSWPLWSKCMPSDC